MVLVCDKRRKRVKLLMGLSGVLREGLKIGLDMAQCAVGVVFFFADRGTVVKGRARLRGWQVGRAARLQGTARRNSRLR